MLSKKEKNRMQDKIAKPSSRTGSATVDPRRAGGETSSREALNASEPNIKASHATDRSTTVRGSSPSAVRSDQPS